MKNQAHLPHQPKVFIHFRFHGVNLCHERVFEAPQNFVDSAGHENVDADAAQVQGDHASKEEGVGIQLVHDRLTKTNGEKEKKIKKFKPLPSHKTASENVTRQWREVC